MREGVMRNVAGLWRRNVKDDECANVVMGSSEGQSTEAHLPS